MWRTGAPGKPIVLVGHHDTVFPPGHFEGWREDGGRATGPGALDMKGGLAVIHAALAALEAAGQLAQLPDRRGVRRGRGGRLADLEAAPRADRAGRAVRAGVRIGTRRRRDHHAAQGRRCDDRDRPRQGRARRQQPQGRRERDLGAREVRRCRAAADRLLAWGHRQRRDVQRWHVQEHRARDRAVHARPAVRDGRRRAYPRRGLARRGRGRWDRRRHASRSRAARTGSRSNARPRRSHCATSTRRARRPRASGTARPRCSAAARMPIRWRRSACR